MAGSARVRVSGPVLLIDTATRHAVVAIAGGDGSLLAAREWDSPHRHGDHLLRELDELMSDADVAPTGLAAVAVGTGPGSFTGLRIGLATAKVIGYTVGCPVIGLSTTMALAGAAKADGAVAVVLPAGSSDRYVARYAANTEITPPQLLPAAHVQSVLEDGDLVLAVDLSDEELGASAAEQGRAAQAGLSRALAALAAEALGAGRSDDLAALVPSYVALPRGAATSRDVEWSPDLR